jgi:DNA-binding response OmpR family regulator
MSRDLPLLPACAAVPSLQADAARLISAQEVPRRTILVVEDDFFLHSAVVDVLCRRGFTVFAARDTNKAWDCLQCEAIDLLVTDIRLPGFVDGLALAALIRKQRPELKIVVASGQSPAGNDRAKADEWLCKPYQYDDLVTVIDGLLGDGTAPAGRRPFVGGKGAVQRRPIAAS